MFIRLSPLKALLAVLLAVLTGCASQPENPDPWEGMNRQVFAFNEVADKYVAKPIAKGYQAVLPSFAETGIDNMFNNLHELLNIVADLGQFKFKAAATDATRFVVNSTVGVAGFFEVAAHIGLPRRTEDFGQTLGYWGVGPGPYVVLPILGPSTVRDAGAAVIDAQVDAVSQVDHVRTRNQLRFLDLVNTRANLLKTESLLSGDRYTFMRDAYLQRREYLISDGAPVEDSFGEEEFEEWDDF
ncbi:VacJ family lipoprotein [Litorivivens sp.]|uniref:MlaA family lipoprotein n=1 Tax=Litorivivens sp. TaxID=2020868 RepID=UPI00356384D1